MRASLIGGLRKLTLSRRGGAGLGVGLRIGAVLLLALFLILSAFGTRTFLLEFRTTTLDLNFGAPGGSWSVPAATLCRLDPSDPSQGGSVCNPADFAIYREETLVDPVFAFGSGTALRARILPGDTLVLTVEAAGSARFDAAGGLSGTLPEGATIRIAYEDWRSAGAFAFEGRLRAGAIQTAGQRAILKGGRWEARQAGFLAGSLADGPTEVVKSGVLVRGSQVEIVAGDGPALVYGYFGYAVDEGGAHMAGVALSDADATGVQVSHFGTAVPSVIRPDLIDVAISSPLLLAAAVILSLLASATQVYVDLVDRPRQPRRDPPRA